MLIQRCHLSYLTHQVLSLSKEMPSSTIATANAITANVMTAKKQKKEYIKLTGAQRLQIGRKASEIGTAAAIRFYKRNFQLMEPTVMVFFCIATAKFNVRIAPITNFSYA